jgi:hypothetical protein
MNQKRYKELSSMFRKCNVEVLNDECSHSEWDAFMYLLFRQGEDLLKARNEIARNVGLSQMEVVIQTTPAKVYDAWCERPVSYYNYRCKHEINFGA